MSAREEGTWSVKVYPKIDSNAVYIASDDFHHDVMLRVSGDFADLNQKKAYAEEIAKRLNYYNSEVIKHNTWPDTEERIDIIGSNGNCGDHYEVIDCLEEDRAYSHKYDAYYSLLTGVWVEPKCKDSDCRYCSNRPEKAF